MNWESQRSAVSIPPCRMALNPWAAARGQTVSSLQHICYAEPHLREVTMSHADFSRRALLGTALGAAGAAALPRFAWAQGAPRRGGILVVAADTEARVGTH